jgi:transposase InsO family protein
VILDDFTHFLWIVPLRQKSDAYVSLASFRAYIHTQFNLPLVSIQCDNGREFDNAKLQSLTADHGIQIRFSCPYTSQQNGKAERVIRTVNDIMRSLLFQASLPPCCWVESLHHATHVLNHLPTKTISVPSLYFDLHHIISTTRLFVFLVVFVLLGDGARKEAAGVEQYVLVRGD